MYKITATAPTVYQLGALRHFGMGIKEVGNGSYTSEQLFYSEQDAKDYLTQRAMSYYSNYEGEFGEHLEIINKYGHLEIDCITASIEDYTQ